MKNFKALKKYLRGSYGIVILSFVFALLSVAAKMAVPFVTGLGVDVIREWMKNPMQEDHYSHALLIDLVLMIGLILCGTVFRYFFDFTTALCWSTLGQEDAGRCLYRLKRSARFLFGQEPPRGFIAPFDE